MKFPTMIKEQMHLPTINFENIDITFVLNADVYSKECFSSSKEYSSSINKTAGSCSHNACYNANR